MNVIRAFINVTRAKGIRWTIAYCWRSLRHGWDEARKQV